jgi:hypothetical protein
MWKECCSGNGHKRKRREERNGVKEVWRLATREHERAQKILGEIFFGENSFSIFVPSCEIFGQKLKISV